MDFIFSFHFSVFLTLFIYMMFFSLQLKYKTSILNPYIWTMCIIVVLLFFGKNLPPPFTFSYQEQYKPADDFISSFIGISMLGFAVLAYNYSNVLKKYFLIITLGTCFSITLNSSLLILFAKLLNLDRSLYLSLFAKSISTAFGIEVSNSLGVNVAITVIAINITGAFGNAIIVPLFKFLKENNKVAMGTAVGSTCHVMGTSKLIEVGEFEGSVSGFSLIIAGLYMMFVLLPILEIINI